jgi:hypothetical protein
MQAKDMIKEGQEYKRPLKFTIFFLQKAWQDGVEEKLWTDEPIIETSASNPGAS